MKRLLLVLPIVLAACHDTPTQPDPTPLFKAEGGGTVVTTLDEWQTAIANATNGGKILVRGTIDIPGGEEAVLRTANVTIGAATRGSGLRGIPNAAGELPECLICLNSTADGAAVEGLALDGAGEGLIEAWEFVPADDLLRGVTYRGNYLVCGGCATHVFLGNAPGAIFENNVLMGHPGLSAIQIQSSPGARIINNWIEQAGRRNAIRNPDNVSAGLFVVHNTIVSAVGTIAGIFTHSGGGTYVNNRILEVVGGFSCQDASVGAGTAGTANKWVANRAPVASDPVGICGPIP